jgi:hypothetical protein
LQNFLTFSCVESSGAKERKSGSRCINDFSILRHTDIRGTARSRRRRIRGTLNRCQGIPEHVAVRQSPDPTGATRQAPVWNSFQVNEIGDWHLRNCYQGVPLCATLRATGQRRARRFRASGGRQPPVREALEDRGLTPPARPFGTDSSPWSLADASARPSRCSSLRSLTPRASGPGRKGRPTAVPTCS